MTPQIDCREARRNSRRKLDARRAGRGELDPVTQFMQFAQCAPPIWPREQTLIDERNMAHFTLAMQAARASPSLLLQRIMPSDVSSWSVPAVLQRLLRSDAAPGHARQDASACSRGIGFDTQLAIES